MAIGSGLGSQFGMVAEVTYGTAVVVTRFLEIQEESLKNDVQYLFSRGTKDLVTRSSRYRAYSKGCGGGVKFEVMNKGFGLLFKQLFGGSTIAQVGVTTEWVQTFTPDLAAGKTGVMATMQVGRPSVDGTVRAFTYKGVKSLEFEFSSELDGPLLLDVTVDAQSEDTAIALAAASYPTDPASFIFIDGALTIDAVAAYVKAAKVKGKWSLDTDRRFLGAITTKKEPIANGELEITGELTLEFESLVEYNKFVNGTLSALVLTWSFGTITGAATPYKLTMTLPKVVYTGETPVVGSSEVLMLTLPFKALYDGTNPAWTLEYRSSDTAL